MEQEQLSLSRSESWKKTERSWERCGKCLELGCMQKGVSRSGDSILKSNLARSKLESLTGSIAAQPSASGFLPEVKQ